MKTITKSQTLREILRGLPLGEPHEVRNKDYKSVSVRKAITALRKEGFSFVATEAGLIDSIKITRLK